MKIINILNRIIEYSFYILFFSVPIVLSSSTSELFEFNKILITFLLTIVIVASWIAKMLVKKEFKVQRTPLDIPILLFLLANVASTIFSLDRHISIWGYYSRFNGGLFSIIAYILLYYAFVSNFKENALKIVKRIIYVTLASGLFIAVWGLPSHFGYDPTCLLFRGTLDVSCWTTDFQPKVRIFSTLGQPDWMAAYLGVLLPLSIGFFIANPLINLVKGKRFSFEKKSLLISLGYFLLTFLFYLDLIYTKSRAIFLAFWVAIILFSIAFIFLKKGEKNKKKNLLSPNIKSLGISILLIAIVTFFAGQPFSQLQKFTFEGIRQTLISKTAPKTVVKTTAPAPTPAPQPAGELGGTDSSKIRLLVWQGAINAWKNYPIFGTGVETFAFAYYKERPAEHNLTSEWKFLYNKAHNEYLNYLTTTGLFGILSYLSMLGLFLFISIKKLLRKKDNPNQILILSLITGYLTIIMGNFFGFSVVMTNILLFMIPAFIFILEDLINYDKQIILSFSKNQTEYRAGRIQLAAIGIVCLLSAYLVLNLFNLWNADKAYALGYNYDRAGDYQQAYPYLTKAVSSRPSEPIYKDEEAVNNAVLAVALLTQQQASTASAELAQKLAENALNLTNEITTDHPNNIVFAKTRVRVFYTLSQIDPRYMALSLDAIKKAQALAPTDADISYNLGVIYGQMGDFKNAISTLEQTVKLKPDYTNAYYALAIFYHQEAVDTSGKVIDRAKNQKAIEIMKYILSNLSPNAQAIKDAVSTWEKQ